MATSTRPNPTHSHDRMSMICMSHASFDHSMPTAKSAEAHAEPSKAGKATPPFSKAHKSENSVKKTYHHRMDDGSLSMIAHAHAGKSHKDHHHVGDTATHEEDTTMETHDGGVTNGDDNGGDDTTSETTASTTTDTTTGAGDSDNNNRVSSPIIMTPAVGEVKDVILNGDNTKPVVRAPDVSPHGTDTSKLKNEKFTQEVKAVLLHGEKAIGGHNKKQNVDALDMGDGGGSNNNGGAESSSLVASTSNANSSASVRSGAMVGGFCLLVTSAYAVFA
mmetsp:Transcript_32101/g.61504  ORF Transcript_32101/g.61504 Transcript_32101/m.61504 type:complete len:276 (+) Transcript_32101:138-965(+)